MYPWPLRKILKSAELKANTSALGQQVKEEMSSSRGWRGSVHPQSQVKSQQRLQGETKRSEDNQETFRSDQVEKSNKELYGCKVHPEGGTKDIYLKFRMIPIFPHLPSALIGWSS